MTAEKGITGLGQSIFIFKSRNEVIRVDNVQGFPDIGSTPKTIDTTNKDNQTYTSSIKGLQELPVFEFTFLNPVMTKDGSDLMSKLQELEISGESYDFELVNPNGKEKRTGRGQFSVRNNSNNNDDLQMCTLSLIVNRLSYRTFFEAYQLFYDANGGKGPLPSDIRWYEASDNASVLDGEGLYFGAMDFMSWNSARDGTGTDFAPGAEISLTQNMTLYAKYGTT